jgi:hypothetical protein
MLHGPPAPHASAAVNQLDGTSELRRAAESAGNTLWYRFGLDIDNVPIYHRGAPKKSFSSASSEPAVRSSAASVTLMNGYLPQRPASPCRPEKLIESNVAFYHGRPFWKGSGEKNSPLPPTSRQTSNDAASKVPKDCVCSMSDKRFKY